MVNFVDELDYTKQVIENREKYGLYGSNIRILLEKVNEIDYTKQVIENAPKYDLSSFDIKVLLEDINENEFTKEIMKNREQLGLSERDALDLIENSNDIVFIKNCLKNREKYELSGCSYTLINLIVKIGNTDELKEIITNRKEYKLSAETVAELLLRNFDEEVFKLIDKETSEVYRERYVSIQYIKEHLGEFLEIEGTNIKQDILLKMAEKNEVILKGNFDILDERYINILGAEKVNQISCYPYVANRVLGLSDGELKLLGKTLDEYMDITKGEEWTPLANKILDNIGSYRELVSNIEENEDIDISKLIPILIHSNDFDIKTIDDVENFQEIKRRRCKELINGETVEEKQKGVLLKIFGQGMRETKKLISKFGEDIDKIKDEDLKAYIKSLQEILKTKNPKALEEIFKQVEELETNNPLLMERMLKTEYGKLYNNDLFKVEDAIKLPDRENVYSAGTDFKMIITSVGAYYSNIIADYKEDWNRPAIGSQHFCASYIRNDMLGHAPIRSICYGFEEMKEDSLMLSGSRDIGSSGVAFESTARGNERYLAPDSQIRETTRYNEMDFRRIQGGKKKQPDYIVVFRKNGKIPNMDKAEKASEDFGGLPIVVIDEDECLEAEKQKTEELFEEYKKTGDSDVRKQLEEKLRNNRVTDINFCRDTDMDRVLASSKEKERTEEEAKVTMEDLDEIYGEVTGKERQEERGRIKAILTQIRDIKRGEVSDGER